MGPKSVRLTLLIIISGFILSGCTDDHPSERDSVQEPEVTIRTGGIAILNSVGRTENSSEGRVITTLYLTVGCQAGSQDITLGPNGESLRITIYNGSLIEFNPIIEITDLIDYDENPDILARSEMINLTIYLDLSDLTVRHGEEFGVVIYPPDSLGTLESYTAPHDLSERFILLN